MMRAESAGSFRCSAGVFLGAASAALVACGTGLSVMAAIRTALIAMLAAISAHDARTRRIENGSVVAIAGLRAFELLLVSCGDLPSALRELRASLFGAAAVLAFLLLSAHIMGRRTSDAGIGGGDVKLFAALGFSLGCARGFSVIALSCALLLAVQGIGTLLHRSAGKTFAFAPYIAAAVCIVLLAPLPWGI